MLSEPLGQSSHPFYGRLTCYTTGYRSRGAGLHQRFFNYSTHDWCVPARRASSHQNRQTIKPIKPVAQGSESTAYSMVPMTGLGLPVAKHWFSNCFAESELAGASCNRASISRVCMHAARQSSLGGHVPQRENHIASAQLQWIVHNHKNQYRIRSDAYSFSKASQPRTLASLVPFLRLLIRSISNYCVFTRRHCARSAGGQHGFQHLQHLRERCLRLTERR